MNCKSTCHLLLVGQNSYSTIRVVQMGYYVIFGDFPKTSGRMGTRRYHNLAQRDLKPQKWTFQTHSFSKHSKILESTKYKYIFGSTEVEEKMFFPEIPTHICVLRHTRRIPGPYCQIRVQIAKKKVSTFCVIFLTYLNTFLRLHIWFLSTKQHFL